MKLGSMIILLKFLLAFECNLRRAPYCDGQYGRSVSLVVVRPKSGFAVTSFSLGATVLRSSVSRPSVRPSVPHAISFGFCCLCLGACPILGCSDKPFLLVPILFVFPSFHIPPTMRPKTYMMSKCTNGGCEYLCLPLRTFANACLSQRSSSVPCKAATRGTDVGWPVPSSNIVAAVPEFWLTPLRKHVGPSEQIADRASIPTVVPLIR
jgi:hypothetical protein